jgi:acyl-CoA reductase-like NAD-dependent aldehyde dehydrogenase
MAEGAPSGVFPSDEVIAQAVARAEEKQIRQALDKARQAQQRWIYRSFGR